MYAIDFTTCTAIDVIQRSITCHPSLLRDDLLETLVEDTRYAVAQHHSPLVRDAIDSRVRACRRAISAVDAENVQAFADDLGAGIIALNLAAQLQFVPRWCLAAMAERTWPAPTV